jgi:hypothetical protein
MPLIHISKFFYKPCKTNIKENKMLFRKKYRNFWIIALNATEKSGAFFVAGDFLADTVYHANVPYFNS